MPKIFVDPPNALSRRVPGLFLAALVVLDLLGGSQSVLLAPINISRAQYETALAKWNGLHVAEYEETARFQLSGYWYKWKVIVEDPTCTNSAESLTRFESLDDDNLVQQGDVPVQLSKISQDHPLVQDTTVGGLFRTTDDLLQYPSVSRLVKGDSKQDFIQFDPAMGYPHSVMINYVHHIGTIEMRIVNVRVLKQCSNQAGTFGGDHE